MVQSENFTIMYRGISAMVQSEELLIKLSTDLIFAQVFFAISLVDTGHAHVLQLVRRRFRELMFHNYPPLLLTEEDKNRKLIYPSRLSNCKEEDMYYSTLLKSFK